ncbi:hypothetical protein E3P99_02726 [Wallemia hederae]|uniref:Co-chaperone HscB C-terminal oligomerisation domain-containing protein n=1 Tax=Wallemia hederae TaxID=1540922 RepID=A0A4T0FN12_9BASI|nr:hypothetical protein E3P99_02726 [Wallemia hederae]
MNCGRRMFNKLGADTDHNNHANISSQINKSYETLLNPLSRAVHLLELNGIEIAEADSIQDTSLLIEVLDLREQLEDAETEDQVAELRQENQESITQTIQHLSQAFQDQDLQQAKNFTIKLRYLTNLDTAARDWQPNTPITLHH